MNILNFSYNGYKGSVEEFNYLVTLSLEKDGYAIAIQGTLENMYRKFPPNNKPSKYFFIDWFINHYLGPTDMTILEKWVYFNIPILIDKLNKKRNL